MITLTREEAQQVLDALKFEADGWELVPKRTRKAIGTLRARLAQPEKEQEPVAWMHTTATGETYFRKKPHDKVFNPKPVYTALPQREWQGLTDEEIRNEAKNHVFDESFFSGAIWARGQIMGKNNG